MEILYKAHINPRQKRNQVLAIALHNMGAHPGSQKEKGEILVIEFYQTGYVVSNICA